MKKIVIILICLLSLCACKKSDFEVDKDAIRTLDYSEAQEFPNHLDGYAYEVIDMSEFKVLYSKNISERIYPASLTKLLTLDTVLNVVENLNDKSSISLQQIQSLIDEDASLAWLKEDREYTIKELLYALVLPSGADSALALENYFAKHGMNLIEQMNTQAQNLGCKNTHVKNTTGLHDDDHYMSVEDICLIIMDCLKFSEGKKVLETIATSLNDGTVTTSTLGKIYMDTYYYDINVLGGKTGYTPESGRSIACLAKIGSHSILIIETNVEDTEDKKYSHYYNAESILYYLKNNVLKYN